MKKLRRKNRMNKVAPSILSADFSRLEQELKKVEAAGADMIHVDVMDGHFVPNITIGPLIVKAAKKSTRLPLDVHLMIENPDRYIPDFARAGASIISIHAESSKNLREDIESIKLNNCIPAVTINPKTDINAIADILPNIKMVLVMSVNPGFEGQKFMPEVLPKISRLREIIKQNKLSVDIQIDGGINLETAPLAVRAGANVLVAGSAIFYAKDINAAIQGLKNAR
jgi:ribulose-phosphate 3-epimerase